MSRISLPGTLVLLLSLLFYACETEPLLPEGELETEMTPTTEDLRAATLSEVDVTLKDGALAFANARELSRAVYALNNATTAELDAWAAGLGFESWGREFREIQARLEANTEVQPRDFSPPMSKPATLSKTTATCEPKRTTVPTESYSLKKACCT